MKGNSSVSGRLVFVRANFDYRNIQTFGKAMGLTFSLAGGY